VHNCCARSDTAVAAVVMVSVLLRQAAASEGRNAVTINSSTNVVLMGVEGAIVY